MSIGVVPFLLVCLILAISHLSCIRHSNLLYYPIAFVLIH